MGFSNQEYWSELPCHPPGALPNQGIKPGSPALQEDSLLISLVAQMVKSMPAMRETWVQSLGQEDPLEEGIPTHSSILAWRIPWTEEPSRLQSMGLQRVGHD